MNRPLLAGLFVFACSVPAFFTVGCGDGGSAGTDIDNGFESDDPSGRSSASRSHQTGPSDNAGGGEDASAAAGDDAGGSKDNSPQRTIEEADIVSVDGNLLYALSRYGGLSVVDIGDPDHMKVLGRKRTEGMPFEMYVQNGRAYVEMNSFGHWIAAEGSDYGQWIETSELLTLDVHDPSAITEIATYDVPGEISDSRIVGSVLYLVTFEGGYCWHCGQNPATVVTSFDVGSGIKQVDQLVYTAGSSTYAGWKRSVTATDQRMYIAGPQWDWTPGMPNAHSIIQVVDISDPAGTLKKGADVPVAGQITSRWQMDESGGVLRVVSQFGNGWGSGNVNPQVQTFAVASSTSIAPLGHADIVLPQSESLQSVRFDGPRGYAVTSRRMDPLFTLDLSDPAHPKQAGQVSMPGWIFHMEPRGDRLVAFGFDGANNEPTGVAVSLFDVSNVAQPSMMGRVVFGHGWSQLPEDQDRIQKAVSVLDSQGLILVPFASYGTWSSSGCSTAQSGIQLIDYSHDGIALRGLAPEHGLPRRAFLANGRLLAMSDRNVTAFDISSRDAPKQTGQIDLSNPAYRMVEVGDQVASITSDWWTGEVMLSLVPRANADDAAVSGKVSLASLADGLAQYCGSYEVWASWYEARLFANGRSVYVVVPVYSYSSQGTSASVIVAAVDASNPLAPRLAGTASMPLSTLERGGWYGYPFWDGWGYWSYYGGALLGSGQGAVQFGSRIAYLEVWYESMQTKRPDGTTSYDTKIHRAVHVVDMASPGAPVVFPAIDLPDSLGLAPMQIESDGVVLTTRWVPSALHPDKVRFFVDRIDISGDAPVRLPSVNTPGSLVMIDEPSQRMVTVDYAWTRTLAVDWQQCQAALGPRAMFDYDAKTCVVVNRSFKLSDMDGTAVRVRQTFDPPAQNIAGIVTTDDRIYVTLEPVYSWALGPNGSSTVHVTQDGGFWALGGVRDGNLSIVSQLTGSTRWPLAAHGTKVAMYGDYGLAIYDTQTPAPTLSASATLRGWGYASQVMMDDDRAICTIGEFGMQTIKY